MPRYSMTWDNIASGAVADTYRTVAALIVPDTAGNRFRLLSLAVGFSDDSPVDLHAGVMINRTDGTANGTAGSSITGANMPKKDPDSVDSIITGGLNYSGGEPTEYEDEEIWGIGLYGKSGFIKEWSELDAPIVTQDLVLGVLVCPRTAAAVTTTGSMEFEVF